MTDNELLSAIYNDMQVMKTEMQSMKTEMQSIKADIKDINQRLTKLELHIETTTDNNLKLLAENHIELVKKLNKAIPAADKNLLYETKINYLTEKVEKIEKELVEIKDRIA